MVNVERGELAMSDRKTSDSTVELSSVALQTIIEGVAAKLQQSVDSTAGVVRRQWVGPQRGVAVERQRQTVL